MPVPSAFNVLIKTVPNDDIKQQLRGEPGRQHLGRQGHVLGGGVPSLASAQLLGMSHGQLGSSSQTRLSPWVSLPDDLGQII